MLLTSPKYARKAAIFNYEEYRLFKARVEKEKKEKIEPDTFVTKNQVRVHTYK